VEAHHLDIVTPKFGFPPRACPRCGQPTKVEAKGTSPKRSSRWRVNNPDGSQHSCHTRRRPIWIDRDYQAVDDTQAVDSPEPVDLTRSLAAFKPYNSFRRYDGYDSQLHRSQSRHGSW
jgi:hypothetical protein